MRLCGKKFVKRAVDRRVSRIKPDRDGVIWSINDGIGLDWYALVRIQGSDTLVKAKYPQAYRDRNEWLRPGTPVIIRHPEGNRGYMEIMGVGSAVPTVLGGDYFPDIPDVGDRLVTEGVLVTETITPGMRVNVEPFDFVIGGETYHFMAEITNGIVMDDPAPMIMDDPAPAVMGAGEYIVEIDAPPAAGYGRYDILVVGADCVIDYIAGTPVLLKSEPTVPDIPAEHILVKKLFVWSGIDALTNGEIGEEWSAPEPKQAGIVFSGDLIAEDDGIYTMYFDAEEDYPTCIMNVAAKDQYGMPSTLGVTCTIEMMVGTGTISNSASGSFGTTATKLNFQNNHNFIYKRDQLSAAEIGPVFRVSFDGYPPMTNVFTLVLSASVPPV